MVMGRQGQDPMAQLQPVLDKQVLADMQEEVAKTYINEGVVEYAVRLVTATRHHALLRQGASPRATLCVVAMAKAVAQLQGRDYVIPKDVQEAFLNCIGHRVLLTAQAENDAITAQEILKAILGQVNAPVLR